ncbi:MAG: peptidase C45 [Proteobacteria bacterium]|nr:peptidase C45 [Pseudomonadota bacterium]MBS0573754.1 peptidase C45 [Pseudomonadota bacterium]
MSRLFTSTETDPFGRGREFGRALADRIAGTVAGYRAMWDAVVPGYDPAPAGNAALAATEDFAPYLAAEMRGMAEGAGLAPALIGAINARTEILAALSAPARGECSAVIALSSEGPPVAMQTWDWYHRFRRNWLVWEIPLADGTTTRTMTECGIVGKAGLNTRGLGLLFTILHHVDDGQGIGVPVHVVARATLDLGQNLHHAAQLAAKAKVSASSSLNLSAWDQGRAAAITVELHPGGPGFVLPARDGLLVHTNHFLDPRPAARDIEPGAFPDTLLRHAMLSRRLKGASTATEVLAALNCHMGADTALCCHPLPGDPDDQYETLATVRLDLAAGALHVHDGGPCTCGWNL